MLFTRNVSKPLFFQHVKSILETRVKSLTRVGVISIEENWPEFSSQVVLTGCDSSRDLNTSVLSYVQTEE